MTAPERFDELVSYYLDEALDEEGMGELNTLLATRPDYAARFVRLSRLHGGLRETAGASALSAARPPQLFLRVFAAAAVMALAGLLFFLLRRFFGR